MNDTQSPSPVAGNAGAIPPSAPPSRKKSILRRLYDWTLTWADTPYGLPALVVISFAESSFFPIPPDALLIPLCFSKPKSWFKYAVFCSVASVAGGVLGWYIGHAFWDLTQDFFFNHIPGFTPAVFDLVRQKYDENAFLAVLTAAFTPIPYKVFTIASGVFDVSLAVVISASVLGRSARFFVLAGLIRGFGPRIRPHLERNFELAALAVLILGILGFLTLKFMH